MTQERDGVELGSLLYVHIDSALAASSGLAVEERAAFAGQARDMLVKKVGQGGEVSGVLERGEVGTGWKKSVVTTCRSEGIN